MIIEQLQKKQIEYLKSGDTRRLGILRYYLSQIKNKEIELRPQGLQMDDAVALKVLKKLIKVRNEVIELYKKAGREDGVQKESDELEILNELLDLFPKENVA